MSKSALFCYKGFYFTIDKSATVQLSFLLWWAIEITNHLSVL